MDVGKGEVNRCDGVFVLIFFCFFGWVACLTECKALVV